MKKEDLGKEIHDLVTLKKDQITATTAKAIIVKSKHPTKNLIFLDVQNEVPKIVGTLIHFDNHCSINCS